MLHNNNTLYIITSLTLINNNVNDIIVNKGDTKIMKNTLKNIKIDNYVHTIILIKNNLIDKKNSIKNRSDSCLMIKKEGRTFYYHDGNEYLCDPNHVIFIPKGSNYDYIIKEHGICYQINFNLENKIDNVISFEINNPEIMNIFEDSANSYLLDSTNETKQYAYIYNIFVKLLKDLELGDDYFSKSLKVIQKEIANPKLDNNYIANEINISEVYLRKLFTKNLGISPRQYLIKIRMEKALSLLFKNESIYVVAKQVGYESLYSFSRAFKNYYKESPQKYIKKYQ